MADGQWIPRQSWTDEIVASISDRYIELYEHITGEQFKKEEAAGDVLERIEKNVLKAL